ncbi:hypothetical protein Zm00014a_044242 [Zea mays]
MSPHW